MDKNESFCKSSLYGSPLSDWIWTHQVVWKIHILNGCQFMFSVYKKMAVTKIAYFLPCHVSVPCLNDFGFRSSVGTRSYIISWKLASRLKVLMVEADLFRHTLLPCEVWKFECVLMACHIFLSHHLGSL